MNKTLRLQHVWTNLPYSTNGIRRENWEPIKQLAQRCVDRANAQPEFAQRDALVNEFWIGAAVIAKITGMTALSEDIAKLGVLEVSKRGYAAILELALF